MSSQERERKGGKRFPKSAARGRKKTSARKKKAVRKRASKKSRRPAPLERLRADEPRQVLNSLIRRHPELRQEAEELALEIVSAVDAERLGSELGRRLAELDMFDAADGSPRDGRYVAIWDAAQQTLDGLLEPYLVDLQRRIELGLKEAAQATCLGIVLGLHSARDQASDDSLLAHVPRRGSARPHRPGPQGVEEASLGAEEPTGLPGLGRNSRGMRLARGITQHSPPACVSVDDPNIRHGSLPRTPMVRRAPYSLPLYAREISRRILFSDVDHKTKKNEGSLRRKSRTRSSRARRVDDVEHVDRLRATPGFTRRECTHE